MTDELALSLGIKLKDLYSGKLDKVHQQSKAFQKTTESLKKSVSDVQAFQSAQSAMDALAKKERSLQTRQQALSKALKDGATLSDKQRKELEHLNKELQETKTAHAQALKNVERLGKGLKTAGVDTKNLANEMDRLQNEMKEVGDQTDRFSKLKTAGKGAGVAAGAGGILAGLAFGASQFNTVASQTAAATGMTSDAIGRLRDDFLDIYKITGTDTDTIAETYRRTTQQLNLSGKAAKDAAIQFLSLQKVHPNMDTNEVVRAAAQMKKAWGISAADAVDRIAIAMEKAGDNADDLLDTFWEYSPTMQEAGLSADQFTAMLIEGAKNGAYNFDKMADSIKESFRGRITDAGIWKNLVGDGDKKKGIVSELLGEADAKTIRTQLANLKQGIVTDDAKLKSGSYAALLTSLSSLYEKDATKARNIIEQIFGSMGADDLTNDVLAAMGKGIQSPDKVLGNVSGTLNRQLETSKTLTRELGEAWRTVSSEFIKSAASVAVALAPVGTMILKIAKSVAGFMTAHPMLTKIAIGLTGVAAAAGTVVAVIGAAGAAYGVIAAGLATAGPLFAALTSGLGMLSGAIGIVGTSLMTLAANPVGAIIMGVAALAAGLYQLYKHFDKVKEAVGFLWDGLKNLLSSGFSKLAKLLPHSDAEEGPLSNLTESGKAIPMTLADGVYQAMPEFHRSMKQTMPDTSMPQLSGGIMPSPANASGPMQIHINISPNISISGNTSADIETQLIAVFTDPSAGLLWELEQVLKKVMG
jgi:phage-related minor tail protein